MNRVENDFRIRRHFIWVIDSGEVRDLPGARARVHAFSIAAFTNFKRRIDVDLNEAIAADE